MPSSVKWVEEVTTLHAQHDPGSPLLLQCPHWQQGRATLTCSTFSSLSSVKTVPVIWLGFRATQFKSGILNLVWMGFLAFTPETEGVGTGAVGGGMAGRSPTRAQRGKLEAPGGPQTEGSGGQ